MWPNPQFPTDFVTFTEEILNETLHFLCSAKFTDGSNDLLEKNHVVRDRAKI